MAIGELIVKIVGDTAGLTRDLATAAQQTDSFSAKARSSLNTFATGAAVAFGAAVAGVAALYSEQSKLIDQTAKFADSIGISTEALMGLRYAAELTGVQQTTLDNALKKVNIKLKEAADGNTETAATFRRLGIDVESVLALPVEQRIGALADGMQALDSQTERTALAMKLFEEEGVALVNTLAGGSDGLEAMAKEAEMLGYSLSRLDAAKVEQANDAISRVSAMSTGFKNQLTVELAPVIEGVATGIKDWALGMGGFGEVSKIVVNFLIGAAGKVGDVFRGWNIILTGVKALFLEVAATAAEAFASISASAQEPAPIVDGFFSSIAQGMANVSADAQRWAFGKSASDVMREASGSAQQWATDTRAAANGAMDELNALLSEPLPSDAAQVWLEDWRQKSAEAAQVTAEMKAEAAKPAPAAPQGPASQGFETISDADDINLINERLAMRAETVEEWRALELQALADQHAYEMELVQERYDLGLLAEEDFQRLKTGIQQEGDQARAAMEAANNRTRLATVKGMLDGLAGAMSTGSRKMFEISKIASISSALVSGYEAVVSSYAAGAKIGGPWTGAAYAAVAGLAVMGQIRQIKAQSFGGGGSVSGSSGGSAPSASSAPDSGTGGGQEATNAQPSRNITISLAGERFSADAVRELITQINEQIGDGATLIPS